MILDEIRGLRPGFELHGVIGGKVQLIHVVEAMLHGARGADLVVSTFGVNAVALDRVDAMIADGTVAGWKLFLSDRLEHMNRTHGGAARARLGSVLRSLRMHAKIVIVRAPDRCLTALTSANLNRTSRIESMYVSTDPAYADHFTEALAGLERVGAVPGRDRGYYTTSYERAFRGDGASNAGLRATLKGWAADER